MVNYLPQQEQVMCLKSYRKLKKLFTKIKWIKKRAIKWLRKQKDW